MHACSCMDGNHEDDIDSTNIIYIMRWIHDSKLHGDHGRLLSLHFDQRMHALYSFWPSTYHLCIVRVLKPKKLGLASRGVLYSYAV